MKMGMMDVFCSSPASTATRKSHTQTTRHLNHETYDNASSSSNSMTPRLIRVLSTTSCRGCSSSDVTKPAAVSRHEYKQLLQKQNSSSYSGGGGGMEMSGEQLQLRVKGRRSSADVKVSTREAGHGTGNKYDGLLKKHSDSGTLDLVPAASSGRRSISSYDVENKLEIRRCSSRPPLTIAGAENKNENDSPKLKSSPGYNHGSTDKVLVLWVSLHCKGCEAKVRKHISKMEGVKSFSIDWMTKRVTIISNMDPHDVLASVSAVKYAYFWPSSSDALAR